MKDYLWECILKCRPSANEDDIKEIKELNEWDVLIVFKDGEKFIYDRFYNYHRNIFYDGINELTEEQEKKEFAYRLRSLMDRNLINQEQLAEMIDTSQVMISRYINGGVIPSVMVLRKIAKVLNCSMDDFFYKEY